MNRMNIAGRYGKITEIGIRGTHENFWIGRMGEINDDSTCSN